MAKKGRRKVNHQWDFLRKNLALLVAMILMVISFGIIYWNYTLPQRVVVEDRAHEMKSLPKALEKKVERIATDSATIRIPVLMYHYVEYVQDKKDTIRQSLSTLPTLFEDQIKSLKDADFTFLTMTDLADIIDGKKEPPQNGVVITFDDGYRDFYTDVYPILKKYNVKAVAYVVPGFFDKPNYMFSGQVREIAKEGLVEIGAHTMHHVNLKGMDRKEAEVEIIKSKTLLEELFEIPVTSFAYPYGSFDDQAIDIVEKAKFRTAVSTIPGIVENKENRFFLFRIRPGKRVGEELTNYFLQDTFTPW